MRILAAKLVEYTHFTYRESGFCCFHQIFMVRLRLAVSNYMPVGSLNITTSGQQLKILDSYVLFLDNFSINTLSISVHHAVF